MTGKPAARADGSSFLFMTTAIPPAFTPAPPLGIRPKNEEVVVNAAVGSATSFSCLKANAVSAAG